MYYYQKNHKHAIIFIAYLDSDSNHYFKLCVEIYYKIHKIISPQRIDTLTKLCGTLCAIFC
jgi:hypothetical protein